MVLQGPKSTPQKSRPLESGHRRYGVRLAIKYSYKLGQKNEFKFYCELGWFLQRQSHIVFAICMHMPYACTHMARLRVWYNHARTYSMSYLYNMRMNTKYACKYLALQFIVFKL